MLPKRRDPVKRKTHEEGSPSESPVKGVWGGGGKKRRSRGKNKGRSVKHV